MRKYFKDWNLFEKGLLIFNLVATITLFTLWGAFQFIEWIGLLSSITNGICVILVARRKVSNYIWGIFATISYGIYAYYYSFTGEWMLNLIYYLPMNIFGWIMWSKNSQHKTQVVSKTLGTKNSIIVYSTSFIGIILFALIISISNVQIFLYGESTRPFWQCLIDGATTTLSITAMILLVKCYREQWILWIIVDVISLVILWGFIQFDLTMIVMWLTFTINAIYGYIKWGKNEKLD